MADPITQVGALTLRLDVDRALTHAEGDANLKILRDFSNMLSSWIEGVVDDEGTFKDGAIREAKAIVNRIITADHLDLSALNFYQDAGTEDNIYLIKLGGPGGSDLRLAELPSVTSGKSILIWMYSKRENTGPSYLKIEKGEGTFHENVLITKRDNTRLLPADIKADELVCLVYEPTTSTFRMIGGAGGAGGAGGTVSNDINFTGLTEYASTQGTELTGAGTHTFFHYLNGTPSHIQVYLECTADDAGYVPGDRIPVDQFTDGTVRSFSVQWNATHILVEELPNTPKVVHRTNGTLDAISTSAWSLYAKAWMNKSVATIPFPDLQFGFNGIAFGYNDKFYGWSWNHDGNREYFYEVDIRTRNILRIPLPLSTGVDMDAARRYHQSGTVWRKADGKDYLLVNDSRGWYQVLLAAPWTTKLVGVGDNWNYRPAWLDEGGAGLTTNPDTYAFCGGEWQTRAQSILLNKQVWNSTKYVRSTHGSALNLQHASVVGVNNFIANSGANPYVIQVQYNPHDDKRRIYVLERNTGGLSIFNIGGHVSNDLQAWWSIATPTREAQLTYEKTIILPPFKTSGGWVQRRYKFFVECNLETGEEIAIWTSKESHDNAENHGMTVRTPWVE